MRVSWAIPGGRTDLIEKIVLVSITVGVDNYISGEWKNEVLQSCSNMILYETTRELQWSYLLVNLMLKKGGMMENEQQGVIFGQQKMIGQVVDKLDRDSSHCTETPSIK